MEKLDKQIRYYCIDLKDANIDAYEKVESAIGEGNLVSPFTENNIRLAGLLSADIITLDDYIRLEKEYGARNKFLYTFEFSGPRTFGESWAQEYIHDCVPQLQTPSKDHDQNYSGEYDFWYKGIRIEVKASRAVEDKSGGKLVDKALYSSDTQSRFNMNFQQIKPACCDVFIWMGVWRDAIRFWVLSSEEVESNEYYSRGQHRGNVGEGQLWIKQTNIDKFDQYLVTPENLLKTIIAKAGKAF